MAMNGERQIQLPDISPYILRHTCAARLGQRQDVILKCFNTLWGILISEPQCRYIIMWMKDV